jgi:hypothetical protein
MTVASGADRAASATSTAALQNEFRVFAEYLGSRAVSERLPVLYARMHRAVEAASHPRGRRAATLDALLLSVARHSPFGAGLADAYARWLRPYGPLRRKLTLTLALLESAAETHAAYDAARPASAIATWIALAGAGCRWAGRTVLAVVILGPLHLVRLIVPNASPSRG